MGNKEILFSHNFFWASRIIRSELLGCTQFFYEQSLDKVFHLNPKFGNSTIPKKTGAFNLMSCVWSIHASFSNWFVLSFSFHYERKTKAHFISYAKENGCWVVWSVFDCLLQKRHQNCEKHKPVGDSLDDIHCSKFQSYTLTQTTFEMTQFKMPRGTYDPLWIISRLNTETVPSVLKRLQFMQNKFKIYTPHTFIQTLNMFGQLLVLIVILLDLMITPTPYTIHSYPFKCQ